MFQKLFLESKPKDFIISLQKPNSKKYQVSKNGYSPVKISIDEDNYAILANGEPMVWVSDVLEWNKWSWNDFGSGAAKKIEQMIKYLKEI